MTRELRPCLAWCGGNRVGDEKHPLLTPDGSPHAGACFICALLGDRDRLHLIIQEAAACLHDGKVVQAHKALVLAMPPSSNPPETK
jgi:hypothetical protein